MELSPKTNNLPFLTAKARLNSRYNITMDKDDFIERGYYVWRDIGNIATIQNSFSMLVPEDGIVPLPMDCEFVESVTTTSTLAPPTLDTNSDGKSSLDSSGRRSDVRPPKDLTSLEDNTKSSDSYAHGVSVNYDTGDGFIRVTSPTVFNQTIRVVYTSISVDKDGLPMINDKEVHAIACNLALQEAERKLFQGMKGADVLVQYLKAESDRLLQAAKTPERINDDEIDKLLDIKTTWDRKVYGKRFNPIP